NWFVRRKDIHLVRLIDEDDIEGNSMLNCAANGVGIGIPVFAQRADESIDFLNGKIGNNIDIPRKTRFTSDRGSNRAANQIRDFAANEGCLQSPEGRQRKHELLFPLIPAAGPAPSTPWFGELSERDSSVARVSDTFPRLSDQYRRDTRFQVSTSVTLKLNP